MKDRCKRIITISIAVILAIFSVTATAMEMTVAGNQLILTGPVARGDNVRFLNTLNENTGKIDTVILRNSQGGDAKSGYEIGNVIRERGLKTALSGYCLSSCSRMFLGGVERQFTDDEPVGRTRVGFHGNYNDNDQLVIENIQYLRQWIIAHSDGKADVELVNRWTTIPNRRGMIFFFDSRRLHREDGTSIIICTGKENQSNRWNECEKITGKDGYQLGIFTSSEIVKSNIPKSD